MMKDEEFFDSIRDEARRLRYEPVDAVTLERIRVRIASRLEPGPSVFEVLVSWARPLAASLAAAALALTLGLYSLSADDSTSPLAQPEIAALSEGVFSALE